MLTLRAGDYRLDLDPDLGGSIAAFEYGGAALLRATCGSGPLDTASFPLVPFSNRIGYGRFAIGGATFQLAANFPGGGEPHAIHGFGWQAAWQVSEAGPSRARVVHTHPGGAWPWPYRAWQTFDLSPDGLVIDLEIENCGTSPMPTGLGFHPYFPRTERTVLQALHRGEWSKAADGLPSLLDSRETALDWWGGQPVATRLTDTAYTDREGPLVIIWPERGLSLQLNPSATLEHTVIYVPEMGDYFCVEPVSHAVNAINRDGPDRMHWLAPSERWSVTLRMSARGLDGEVW